MALLLTRTVASFGEYVRLVDGMQSRAGNSLWFRGCGGGRQQLVPTLYRHRTKKKKVEIEELERRLMTRFVQRSIPFVSRSLQEDWEALFFMQHHGVPTRLLDWTENPFIAFYFAVTSGRFSARRAGRDGHPNLKFSMEATIWILNPVAWTNHALRDQSYTGGILAPGDDALKRYKPGMKFDDMHMHPVALYAAYNSARIVAQRGVFTIFGQSTAAMEKTYERGRFPKGSLVKVILPKHSLPSMRESILRYGVTESVVFPDLEGLAREMKREFGFEY